MSIDLRPIDPLYEDNIPLDEESAALVYQPVIRISRWMPAEEDVEYVDKQIGLSILVQMPDGTPEPLQCEPWTDTHNEFLRKFSAAYSRADHAVWRSEWVQFTRLHMPPTDYIEDYITQKESSFHPPLCRFLYGAFATGFSHLPRWCTMSRSSRPCASALTTAFVGEFAARASVLDLALVPIVEQRVQSNEWRMNRVVLHPWIFEGYPEHLHRFMIERGVGKKRSKRFGTICAKRIHDINEGVIFKVTFDDGSASYDMPKALYAEARFDYLEVFPGDGDNNDDKIIREHDKHRQRT